MFEIKKRDIAGRLGILKVKNKKVETPLFLPVVNPNYLVISPKEIYNKYKIPAIITNAYIIYRSEHKNIVLEKGLHKFLEFPGIIETDSGSYQMLHYKKDLEISNKEIVEFQINIGSNIINVLDVPTDIEASYKEAMDDWQVTLNRIKEGLSMKKNGVLMNGAIQGGVYPELRKKAAEDVKSLPVDIFAIGTIVPYLINYKFKELLELIMSARLVLPFGKSIHLFGLGHPLIIPLAVAIGCDIFDSASYILYAKDNRYLTPFGTLRLDEMRYLPCSCPICSNITIEELQKLENEERIKLLSEHNLWILKKEIDSIKDAISGNYLWDLVIIKAHSHSSMYKATRFVLENYINWLKKLDPVRKRRGFMYQGELSELRSDFERARERLKERVDPKDYEYIYEYVWPFNSLKDEK